MSERRAKSRDDINRVIIGLGGQGSRIVNEVRAAIRRAGDEPDSVEFVAIDSDRISLANLDEIPKENQVYLQAPDDKITETVVPWLPREFRPKAGGGCGMQRLTGKAMYLVHRQRIFETINGVVRRLRQRTQMNNFMFVVVNAFGGGTGSGMVIDFSIDLRRNMLDLVGAEPMVFGLGVLPSRSETIQRANGVALVKELHFLLSHKEPVVVNGRDFSNPFELYFLVGREFMGIEKDEELAQSIVRFTIDLGLIPSSSNEFAAAGKGAGWVDLQDIRTIIKGASHMFATFGYYRAAFPEDRLKEYFSTLDRIEDAKQRLPGYAAESEAQWTRVGEEKVRLAEAERILDQARTRARRLRTGGILGLNRPLLLRLQEEIGSAEAVVRRRQRELVDLEARLPLIAEEKDALEAELKDLEERRDELLLELATPFQSQNTHMFPLTAEEVDHLAANRKIVTEGNFLKAMEALNRTAEYYDKTMEVIGKNKILFMPMLNYRMAFHTATQFPPPVLRKLADFGFVKFDQGGNPVITDDQLWMVMAMLSSARENVDPQKLSARAFKEVVESYIAKRAEVKTLPSNLKRFEAAVHSWMIGLQVAPIAPGYPPRLKELEWLAPEYDKLALERELIQHHAFLYGDPAAFTELTGLHLDRMNVGDTNERVTEFWARYAPIDEAARWLQVPPVLAETLVAMETVRNSLVALGRELDVPYPAAREVAEATQAASALDQVTQAFRRAGESLLAFQRVAAEDEAAIGDRLRSLVGQLERTREGPKDPAKLQRLVEMAESALGDLASTRRRADELRVVLADSFDPAMKRLRDAASSADVSDRFAATVLARFRRALAEAEEESVRFDSGVGNLLVNLQNLEDVVARLLTHLRSRPLDGRRSVTVYGPRAVERAASPEPKEAPPPEDDLLGRILQQEER